MSGKMRILMKTFSITLAAIVAGTLANGVYAAEASSAATVIAPDAAQKPVEELDQLDEVWVRGKQLSEMIEDAEDDFFVLYNKLNKDSQYDVYCGRMALNNGSMIMVRKCTPGFIVSNYGNMSGVVNYGGDFGCGMNYGYSEGMSISGGSCGGGVGLTAPGSPGPTAEQRLMEKGSAYAANVVKVVTSDPRLLDKVRNLGVLYKDMELVQGHYVKVRGDGPPARVKRKGSGPYVGPRVL